MKYTITSCGLSDIGLVRQKNEDAWGEVQELRLYLLADGMGGHRAGEVAASKAVTELSRLVKEQAVRGASISLNEAREMLNRSIQQTNHLIYRLSRTDEQLRGMGTTLCCMQFHDQGVIYAHVGDSRVYRLRGKRLKQLTNDHSLLRELLDLGQLEKRDAPEFLYKNILTKAMGTEATVDPSVSTCDVALGDLFLMCSDGLSDMLSEDEIEELLNRSTSVQDASQALVSAARQKGGYDNITVVTMQIGDYETPDLSR